MRIVNRKLFHSLFLTAVIRTFRLRIIISVDLCTKLLYSESTFFKVSRTFRLDVVIFNTNKLVLYTSTGHSCRYDQSGQYGCKRNLESTCINLCLIYFPYVIVSTCGLLDVIFLILY